MLRLIFLYLENAHDPFKPIKPEKKPKKCEYDDPAGEYFIDMLEYNGLAREYDNLAGEYAVTAREYDILAREYDDSVR